MPLDAFPDLKLEQDLGSFWTRSCSVLSANPAPSQWISTLALKLTGTVVC